MLRLLIGGSTLVLALLWQIHGNAFLPTWAIALPLWAWFVVDLCTEAEPVETACALTFALVWYRLAMASFVGTIPVFVLMVLVGAVLLRTWLTFRSVWSALVLTVCGHLVFLLADILRVGWGDTAVGWRLLVDLAWHSALWNVVLVTASMWCIAWAKGRFRAYIGSGSRFTV